MTRDSGLPLRGREAFEDEEAQAAQGGPVPTDRRSPPASKPSASAATRTRSARARRCSTRSSRKFPEAGRYPFNSTPADSALVAGHRTKFGQARERRARRRVAGDSEDRVRAFTSPTRPLVTAAPTFENCPDLARQLGHPGHEVKVDAPLRLDLDAMVAAANGAGLVFLNNPNNPTATVHGAQGGHRLRRAGAADFAGHRHPHRRGLSRLRDRPELRDRDSARARRRRTCSSRGRSRRPTAWPACASATRSASADTIKPLARLKHAVQRQRLRRSPRRSRRWTIRSTSRPSARATPRCGRSR